MGLKGVTTSLLWGLCAYMHVVQGYLEHGSHTSTPAPTGKKRALEASVPALGLAVSKVLDGSRIHFPVV